MQTFYHNCLFTTFSVTISSVIIILIKKNTFHHGVSVKNSMKKIAFFDIDGTLTSEIDGSVPASAREAIRRAREAGNLMFLNTGRCFQNVEPRFKEVGFDGYVCGCGTHVVIGDSHPLYVTQPADRIHKIIDIARQAQVDLLLESRYMVMFDYSHPLTHPVAIRQNQHFIDRGYPMNTDIDAPDFTCDKFVFWYQNQEQLAKVRTVSDEWFDCIDRNETFKEFVPKGYSKATGIQYVLDYYGLPLEAAYAFGDSNNDLPMLEYVRHSVAMGNSEPANLKEKVAHVTTNASDNGIANALEELGFF